MTTRSAVQFQPLESRTLLSTYYVSPSGDDANDGSSAAPFQTLQHAANLVVAGDTVLVGPGQYAGFILGWDAPQSGAYRSPIVFKGSPGAVIVSRNSKTPHGIDIQASDYIVIDGLTVNNADGSMAQSGIRVSDTAGVTIRNSIVKNAGRTGLYASFNSNLNIIHNSVSGTVGGNGIYIANSTNLLWVHGNAVFNNAASGIYLSGDASAGGPGYVRGAVIDGNRLSGNSRRYGAAINCDGVEYSRILNNLIYGNYGYGLYLTRKDAAVGSTHNAVLNNTIVAAGSAWWSVNVDSAGVYNTFFNNIILNSNKATGAFRLSPDSYRGFQSNNNLLQGYFCVNGNNTQLTFAQWQRATRQERDSHLTSPYTLFVKPGSGNFRLLPASPAIGAGRKVTFPRTDITGLPRNMLRPLDIGAYIYVAPRKR